MTAVPYDWGEARSAINAAKAQQRAAEGNIRDAYRAYGEAERAYRVALAQHITRLRADGIPVTLCLDLAKGDEKIALLRFKRDIQDGVREAATSAIWRHSADRRELEQLISWSMRIGLTGQYDEEKAA